MRSLAYIALIAIGLIASASFSLDFHVATDGSQPYRTLEEVKAAVRAATPTMTSDIVVYLHAGTYFLDTTITFSEQDGGKGTYNVIYRAYNTDNVVISGGRKITGWTQHDAGKNIWKATVSPAVNKKNQKLLCKRQTLCSSNDQSERHWCNWRQPGRWRAIHYNPKQFCESY